MSSSSSHPTHAISFHIEEDGTEDIRSPIQATSNTHRNGSSQQRKSDEEDIESNPNGRSQQRNNGHSSNNNGASSSSTHSSNGHTTSLSPPETVADSASPHRRYSATLRNDPDSWTAAPIVKPAELHPEDEQTGWRKVWAHRLENKYTHFVILSLVLLDLAVVMTEVFIELFSYQSCLDFTPEEVGEHFEVKSSIEVVEEVLKYVSVVILAIFVAEVFAKFIVFRLRYYTSNLFHTFDALIILISFFVTIFLTGPSESIITFFIFLRLWRVFRIIDGVAVAIEDKHDQKLESLEKKIKKLKEQLEKAQGTSKEIEKGVQDMEREEQLRKDEKHA